MKVLLIEDNETLGGFLSEILRIKGYTVEWLQDGADVLLYFDASDYDIVLLDWMLPSVSGVDIIKMLKNHKIIVPIIMLTAKSELEDKVEGLTTGADDYLTKPFEVDELEARMIAVTKRYLKLEENGMKKGNVLFDITHHLFTIEDEAIDLTHKEYQLLELLFLNAVVTREMILAKVWSSDQIVGDNNIDALVRLLKKKLKEHKATITLKSIRNLGYKLETL